jgi:PAS domain S-box-containing protein
MREQYRNPLIPAERPTRSAGGSLRSGSLFERRRSGAEVKDLCLALVSCSPDCIEILSPDGRWEFINERGLQLLQMDDLQRFEGKRWTESWPPAVREEAERALQAALAGEVTRFQAACPTMKGEAKWWDTLVTPVLGEDGKVQRLVCTSRDITGIKDAEEKLSVALAAAEAASHAKSAFLATMSHEIRTPLNGVLGMAQVMARDDLSEVQRERLETVRRSGEALLNILNDILDLSKIEAGKLEIEQIDFDLEPLVEELRSVYAPMAAEKGLALEVTLDAPAGAYLGDPTRLRQIASNLVSNALKFTPQGQVRVGFKHAEGKLALTVEDTGVGISDAMMRRLFSKFEQADSSTTRAHGGTGLGLAICRELAELMGGTIGVERTEPGSRFVVSIPLPHTGHATSVAVEAEQVSIGELRILAAEDNAVNRQVLSTVFEQLGLSLTVVADGAAAVEAFRTQTWDVILMDVHMPVMDGLQATRAIRALEAAGQRARTPIIALTADAMEHQKAGFLAAGMDLLVAKPLQIGQLTQAIQTALLLEVEAEARAAG